VDWNFRDGCRSYGPDLFDRRLHNLVLVPAQLKHDGGSSSVLAAGTGLRIPSSRCPARATLRQWGDLLRLELMTAVYEGAFAALQLRPAINAKSAGKPEAGRSNMRYAAEEMPYSLRWNSPTWILYLIG
jgi:hypothetical protein